MNTDVQGILAIAAFLYRRKATILGTVFLFAAISGGFSFFMNASYTAVATLYPAKQSAPSSLSSLLSLGERMGFSGSTPMADPSAILVDLATTNSFLKILASKEFRSQHLGRNARLIEIMNIKAKTPELGNYYLIKSLRQCVRFDLDKRSGILTVKVTAPERTLSKDIADTAIRELNAYYRQLVSSKKAAYRLFLENRLKEAEASLKESESRARDYKERNLLSTNSPEILLLQGRYQRDLRINEEIFLTLRKEYEMAKLEEQKDMPALDILDAPEEPVFKSAPMRRKIVMFFSFLGFLTGSIVAFGLENRRAMAGVWKNIAGKNG